MDYRCSQGFSIDVDQSGRMFHVRPDGTPAYEERFEWLGSFHENLARARKDGKWFHIHPDGTPAYKEKYNEIGNFEKGVAWVVKDGKSFCIRHDGSVI